MKHHTYQNSLAEVRANAEVSLDNVALLCGMSQLTLKEIEAGKQRPPLKVIAMYHLLFKAPYKMLFADLCADMHTFLIERSENITAMLESSQSLKSKRRIQAISNLVKKLNTAYDD